MRQVPNTFSPRNHSEAARICTRCNTDALKKYGKLGQKVRRAMGGEVLELIWDRAERLEREAREQGLRDGREQGIEQGRLIALAELVADGTLTPGEAATRLGIDEAEFAKIMSNDRIV